MAVHPVDTIDTAVGEDAGGVGGGCDFGFEFDPKDEGCEEYYVEESFVGDC
jgi:hypothetical protein